MTTQKTERWLYLFWGLVLVTLPVTSFKYLPPILGRATIQPLAFYPLALAWLAIVLLIWKDRRIHWPQQMGVLTALALVLGISTVWGAFDMPLSIRGQDYWGRALRAWLSLGVGLAFFGAAYLASRSEQGLKVGLRWLYIGLLATAAWSAVQGVAMFTRYLDWRAIEVYQEMFSLRGLIAGRVSGFAYEPSWLGDQMVIFTLPWIVASLITGYQVTNFRWVEWLLLPTAVGILLLTYSRSGIGNLAITFGLGTLLVLGGRLKDGWRWYFRPEEKLNWWGWLLRLVIAGGTLAALGGAGWWLNQSDYFANMWRASLRGGIEIYLVENFVGERAANMQAGLNIFLSSPWLGVGFGTSGLQMFDNYPIWAFNQYIPLVFRAYSPDSVLLPNIKNLYVRLLAETGIMGFWLFVAFFLSTLGTIRRALRSMNKTKVFVATAGMFTWIAIMMRNFSQDSLTFPIMWVMLGMVLGYTHHLSDEAEK